MKISFSKYGLPLDETMCSQFERYYELLIDWNQRMNLTTITDRKEVIEKHFIDSVLLLTKYKNEIFNNKTIIDVGTGAGFPGIPLAIMLPHTKFTLIDSLEKRIYFLKNVIDELKLENVILYHGRAEDYGKDTSFREQFDYCVSRAVAPLPILLEYCSPFIKIDGSLLLYKSKKTDQEIQDSQHALDELNCKIGDICTLSENEDYKRYIVEIHKINNTLAKYPRKAGKPKKNPL